MNDFPPDKSASGIVEFVKHFEGLYDGGYEGAAYLGPERWASSGWFPFRESILIDVPVASDSSLSSLGGSSMPSVVSPVRASPIRVSSGEASPLNSSEPTPSSSPRNPAPITALFDSSATSVSLEAQDGRSLFVLVSCLLPRRDFSLLACLCFSVLCLLLTKFCLCGMQAWLLGTIVRGGSSRPSRILPLVLVPGWAPAIPAWHLLHVLQARE